MTTCIGCGCTDDAACEGGCSWLRLDEENRHGICSSCPEFVDGWDGLEDPAPAPSILLPGDAEYSDTLRYLRSR
jgi:hypothetical protein